MWILLQTDFKKVVFNFNIAEYTTINCCRHRTLEKTVNTQLQTETREEQKKKQTN